ncbi:MAG: 4Fe-4S binding protein [Deltaproteobacteria bacterium]|nr:4Fe-4S binding protein [Deltaproteobacteria bacterium]
MSYFRVNDNCNGCLACVQNCPANALNYRDNGDKRTLLHNMTKCARCGNCWRICPNDAVEFQHLLRGTWDEVASMELLRCIVCGEPLYTADFEGTLADKVDHELQNLCPRHRKSLPLALWKRLSPVKEQAQGAEE